MKREGVQEEVQVRSAGREGCRREECRGENCRKRSASGCRGGVKGSVSSVCFFQ